MNDDAVDEPGHRAFLSPNPHTERATTAKFVAHFRRQCTFAARGRLVSSRRGRQERC
ncbi:hypothetical protein JDM601_1465 [Mycolicibacter sinensis]|uniref:Uncharacterized protein n=1 Tax=Mycolicibacter sinensis (strain JDM601) TaxID=875328 RepID=F5YY87_MYCSD|nr:hypothetical protein JDM601_1465 [Mycolicibacter sinensis]